jgi:alpha-L-rhamnosidase
MAMIDRGATTVWERWEGVDADRVPHESLNHYSKGAVIGFLHRYVAGLQPLEPGYRRFRVAPRPGGGIAWAEAHHDSPHGRIAVRWTLDDGEMTCTVDVPAGTTAELRLPGGAASTLDPGHHVVTD